MFFYIKNSWCMIMLDVFLLQGGNTNTTGGLRETRQSLFSPQGGDRAGIRDIIILITDGKPTREAENLTAEINTLKVKYIIYQ